MKLTHIAILIVATLALSLVPVSAIEQAGIGARPANPDPQNPRTSSIFIYEIDSGEQVSDGVVVSNASDEEKTIEVYATDAQTTNTGSFACRQQSEAVEETGSWIQLAEDEVTLEPRSQIVVDFDVIVPPSSEVGEYNACIAVAEVGAPQQRGEGGVALRFRSALRLVVTVPGDILKELSFEGVTLDQGSNGEYAITAALQNTGNVSLDTKVATSLRGIFGTLDENGGTFPVLRDDSLSLRFGVDRPFWGGFYRAEASAEYDSNPESRIGSLSNEENLETIESVGDWVFIAPTRTALYIILGISLLLLAILMTWLYRSGKIFKRGKGWSEHRVDEGEDLQTIAADYGVSWRELARVNKMKAPYTVRPGAKIRVPATKKTKR